MNCERYQRQIGDALAGGETALNKELVAHLRDCAGCREFHDAQKRVLSAMDAGLRSMVNVETPASLFPNVRVRMEDVQTAGADWKLSWQVGALAAVALSMVLGFVVRRGPKPGAVPIETAMTVRSAPEKMERARTPEETVHPIVRRSRRQGGEPFSETKSTAVSAQVLVPAEERAGYEQYIRTVRVGNGSPAKKGDFVDPIEIAPQEIAQLQIKKLELNSLVEEAEE